jgi:hypothetical protein
VPIVEADDLWAETDGKGLDADPAPARHEKMAELVNEHDDGKDEKEGKKIAENRVTET